MNKEEKVDKALVGISGVHFVVAELSRRGWIALPTVRNTKGIDILATRNGKTVQIQVKTRERKRRWPLNKKAESLVGDNLFYVFVNLRGNEKPEYFIIPSRTVAEYLAKTHKLFLEAGGKENPVRALPNRYAPFDLEKYKDNWGLLR